MAYVPFLVRGTRGKEQGHGESLTPVILDHGDFARVAGVALGACPRLGDRFALDGLLWEITRVGDVRRGYVARPIRAGVCVH
jgi:hypothetical protein